MTLLKNWCAKIVDLYQRIFIFPHYAFGVVWLLSTAALAFPYFWLIGFDGQQIRHFLAFQSRMVYLILKPVLRGVRVEYSTPAPTPCILVANHQSAMDSFVFQKLGINEVVCVAKNWPFHLPFYGCYLRKAGFINTDEVDFEELVKRVRECLGNGISVVFFPEGTRSREIKRFHSMPFHVAINIGAPVVPVCIDGHSEMLPPKCYFPRPTHLCYSVLPPVDAINFPGDDGPLRMAQCAKRMVASKLS